MSSFYVLMEYKRVIVKTLIELHAVIREEDSVADGLLYFKESMRPRETKIVLAAVAKLLEEADLQNDKNKVLRNLEMLIEASIEWFKQDVDKWIPNRQL